MTKVITFGVFDYFHYGHLKLLERAKAQGEYLIVAVQRDDEIYKTKPEAKILYTLDQRMELIGALKCVDEVVSYGQVSDDIKKIPFDLFVKGGDQIHSGFIDATNWCVENGKKVMILGRTPNICSSQIKKDIK